MALTPRRHPTPDRAAIVLALSAMLTAAPGATQPAPATSPVEPAPEAQFAEARAALDARRWRE